MISSPTTSAIAETVRNCNASRAGCALERNVHIRLRYQFEMPPAINPSANTHAHGSPGNPRSSKCATTKFTAKPDAPTNPNLTNWRRPRLCARLRNPVPVCKEHRKEAEERE